MTGARAYGNVALAIKGGADAIVLGGSHPRCFLRMWDQPTLAIVQTAKQALQDRGRAARFNRSSQAAVAIGQIWPRLWR